MSRLRSAWRALLHGDPICQRVHYIPPPTTLNELDSAIREAYMPQMRVALNVSGTLFNYLNRPVCGPPVPEPERIEWFAPNDSPYISRAQYLRFEGIPNHDRLIHRKVDGVWVARTQQGWDDIEDYNDGSCGW